MDCPVCQHKEIPVLLTTCPNCNSDLVQFNMLDTLEEEYVAAIKKKIAAEGDLVELKNHYEVKLEKSRRRTNRMVYLLLLLPLLYFTCNRPLLSSVDQTNVIQANNTEEIKPESVFATEPMVNVQRNDYRYIIQDDDDKAQLQNMIKQAATARIGQDLMDAPKVNAPLLNTGDTIFISIR